MFVMSCVWDALAILLNSLNQFDSDTGYQMSEIVKIGDVEFEFLDEPDPTMPVIKMTYEYLIEMGYSESKAEFMMAIASGEIDGGCIVK